MSHRRKSARPTNKLRRNATDASSVSSDSDVDHSNKMLLEECISRDIADTLPAPGPSSPQLALPPDLWQDFQALQAATHLDTASLIRRLISQYGRPGSHDAEGFRQQASPSSSGQLEHEDAAMMNPEVTFTDSGEIVFCGRGDDSVCSGSDVDVVTPHYHHQGSTTAATTTTMSTNVQAGVSEDADEDFSVLDLSSGAGRGGGGFNNSSSMVSGVAASASDDVIMGYLHEDGDVRDTDSPLDLTMSKPPSRASSSPHRSQHHHLHAGMAVKAGEAEGSGLFLTGAPEAHKSPSSLTLSAVPRGVLHSATPTTGAHPRSAHSVRSGTAPSPCHVTSSLFNLSELPVGGSPRPFHSSSSAAAAAVSQIPADRLQQTKTSAESGSSSRSGAGSPVGACSNKQKMVQHFLSLPAGQVLGQDNLGAAVADLFQKQGGCALGVGGGGGSGGAVTGTLFPPEALRHISLGSAIQLSPVLAASSSTSPSSAQSHAHHPASLTTPTGAMQLPTVTSLEFLPGDGEVGGGGGGLGGGSGDRGSKTSNTAEGQKTSQGVTSSAVTSLALPLTSGSALFLDVASGGLVATAAGGGGGLTGVPALNFPVMATGTGGLVAIPFFHALPEAFAAAAAAAAAASAASQGQQPPPNSHAPALPATSTTSSASATTTQHHHQQPAPPPHHHPSHSSSEPSYVPPPPSYSAAMASVSSNVASASQSSRTHKAKIGRPRGQPKTPKVVCKDMKLLTENTLFPGVYTSILKLPWSKRSRGKYSAKIKDVMAKSNNNSSKAGDGGGGGGGSSAVATLEQQHLQHQQRHGMSVESDHQHEPGEVTGENIHLHYLQQQAQQPESTVADGSEAQHLGLVSMPVLVTDGQAPTSSLPPSSSSSSSTSTSSVMMVYQNTGVSEQGKPVRRRGRPPKLPVLSQLLSDKKPGAHEQQHQQYQQHVLDGQQVASDPSGSVLALPTGVPPSVAAAAAAVAAVHRSFASTSSLPAGLTEPCVKQEPMDVSDSDVSKLFPSLGGVCSGMLGGKGGGGKGDGSSSGAGQRQQQQHDLSLKQELDRRGHSDAVLSRGGSMDSGGAGGDVRGGTDVGALLDQQQFQEASLETRFNILANQLGLEIGSPYHASLVYNQSLSSSAHHGNNTASSNTNNSSSSNNNNNTLYQQMMLSSRSMVEMKPRRRQLNNLIKPSDDCVYTSFRIRPRNSGRRGGKRGGGRKSRGSASKYDRNTSQLFSMSQTASTASPSECEEGGSKDGAYYLNKEGGGENLSVGVIGGGSRTGSAVITERIPGAGEVPQRLYQDLYHCKMCNEMLPADSSMLHTCSNATPTSRASPPLRSCQACGTMYLSSTDAAPATALSGGEGSDPPNSLSIAINLCEECSGGGKGGAQLSSPNPALSPSSVSASQQDPTHPFHHLHQHGNTPGEGFACQPCGVHFVNIADYIQHRRSAHLEKMSRQPRKTHTLKTLPCPATGCPRLFHMQAELSRHVLIDHPEHAEMGAGPRVGAGPEEEERGVATTTPTTAATSSSPCKSPPQQRDSTTVVEVDVETVLPAESTEEASSDCVEEDQPQFTCTQEGCGRRFPTPSDLLDHVQSSHEGVSQWPCPLPGCTRQFGAERHLRVHLLIHKDEKPLKCPFCNYRCRQKNALNWHLRKHPEAAGHYRKFATGVSNDC